MRARQPLPFVSTVLLLTACTSASGQDSKSEPPTSGSDVSISTSVNGSGGNLVVIAPLPQASVHASSVVLGTSSTQIGHVTEVDTGNAFGAEIRIALDVRTTIHTDATATVCENLVRVNPGTASMPISQTSVITLVHTVIRPGRC